MSAECSQCTNVNTAAYKNHLQCMKRLMSQGMRFENTVRHLEGVSLECLEHLIQHDLDVSGWDIVDALREDVDKFYMLADACPEALDGVQYVIVSHAIHTYNLEVVKYMIEDKSFCFTGQHHFFTRCLRLCIRQTQTSPSSLHILEYIASKGFKTDLEWLVYYVGQTQHRAFLQCQLEDIDHMIRLQCVQEVTPKAARLLATLNPDPLRHLHVRRMLMSLELDMQDNVVRQWIAAAEETLENVESVLYETTGLPSDVVRYEIMSFF